MTKPLANSVAAYIAKQPREAQAVLRRVRRIIKKALPGALETISYQIPAYQLDGHSVVYFAGWKQHWSLYPVNDTVRRALGAELAGYEFSKGTLRFPLAEKIPADLIERIVSRLATRAVARRAKTKSKATATRATRD